MKTAAVIFVVSMLAVSASADVSTRADTRPDPRLFGAYVRTSSRPALYYSTREEFKPHGRVLVQVQTPSGWAPAGEIQEDQFLRAQSIDLSRWARSGEVTVQLLVEAPGAAHVDSLLVDGNLPLGLDARLTRKLGKTDNDIVPYSEVAGRPLTFKGGAESTLTIVGRIEAAVIGTEPIVFPLSNVYKKADEYSDFYNYTIGSHRWSPIIDGSLNGERLGDPLFKGVFPLGSGHPESPIYGWIGDDGKYFYATMDVTGDNTEDGTKDYAKVFAKTPNGIREFKITTAEKKWGKAGFEYTDKVGWEHKVYEFAIPLSEMAPAGHDKLELAFAAYGTLSIIDLTLAPDPNGVDPDAGSSGTTFTFTVTYRDQAHTQPPSRSNLWIDLNANGNQAETFAFPSSPFPPVWMIILIVFSSMAITFAHLRKGIGRLALTLAAAAFLFACPTSDQQTTQEIYTMTTSDSSPNWSIGVIFTVSVKLNRDPGTFNFYFDFVDSALVGVPALPAEQVIVN
jgi:hypothetical protein